MSKKILLVDDELEIVSILSELLEDLDYSVTTALNGKEALERLESDKFDIMIIDNNMPILTGEEVLSEIYPTKPEGLKIIFASGQTLNLIELVEKAQYFTIVDGLLNKPYKVSQIEDLIDELCD